MRVLVRPLIIAVAAAAVLPGAAGAAATIGSVSAVYTDESSAPYPATLVQTDPSFSAPSAGVITSVSTRVSAGSVSVGFVRGATPEGSIVVGKVDLTGSAGSPVVTQPARFAVQAGDRLAVGTDGSAQVRFAMVTGAGVSVHPVALPAIGGALPAPLGTPTGSQLAVAAKLEADADGDGYGDETQDSCPSAASVHTGPCVVDLRLVGGGDVAAPAGSAAVATATLSVPGTAGATGAKVTIGVPPGVELIAFTAAGGDCDGITCSFGAVAGGASRKVYAVVRGATAGSFPISFTANASEPLTNTGDDAATTTLTVAPAAQAAKLCTVPKLKGKSRSAAATALSGAGCALGKVTGSKRKKVKVKTQTIPAGVQVAAGTKVGVRLG